MDIIDQLEFQAAVIRLELSRRFTLSEKQLSFLPTLEQLGELAFVSVSEILPLFHESTFSQVDKNIPLNDWQRNQWDMLEALSGFNIDLIFAIDDSFATDGPKQEQGEQESRIRNLFSAYERFCSEIINSRNQPRQERTVLGNFLIGQFPMPPDEILSKIHVVGPNHWQLMREALYVPAYQQKITDDGLVDRNNNPIVGPVYNSGPTDEGTEFAHATVSRAYPCYDVDYNFLSGDIDTQDDPTLSAVQKGMLEDMARGKVEGQFWGAQRSLCEIEGSADDQGEYKPACVRNKEAGRFSVPLKYPTYRR